jgi:carbamoylphosphate synthase large subunit
VVIDRISHEVPYYRSWLKHAVLEGATVVNNPFMWTADDKFFGASLATRLGVAHPKTVALPNREYVPGIKHDESLRNLSYPLDWDAIIEHVGMPCILKDAHGGGWRDVHVCHTPEQLLEAYNASGRMQMIVQEFIRWDHFVRCICIGREQVMPIHYDPRERRYVLNHNHLSSELGERVVGDALKLVRALGYDMNSIEFAIRDGVPYAIDFMNPAPDMDVNSLSEHYFDWAVNAMADMAIRLALEPRPQLGELHWSALFGSAAGGEGGGGAAGENVVAERPGGRAPGTTGGSGTGGSVLGEVADIRRGNL